MNEVLKCVVYILGNIFFPSIDVYLIQMRKIDTTHNNQLIVYANITVKL